MTELEVQATTLDPHLSQKDYVPIIETSFNSKMRILSRKAPRQEYVSSRKSIVHTPLHWGQRKLLLSEIEFLTNWGDDAKLVVYAGSAGGYHIPLLSALFPYHKFDLYDPAPFAITETDKIKIYNVKMTNKVAKSYRNIDHLFLSDTRTVSHPGYIEDKKKRRIAEQEYAKNIFSDNAMQHEWIENMRPLWSMVKFKLPYEDINGQDHTVYPSGKIYLPVWGKPTTSESRLVFNLEGIDNPRAYNHKKYEEQMFYFNNNNLLSYYPHEYGSTDVFHPIGIDHCYSCRAEIFILENYLKKINNEDLPELVLRGLVKNLSETLSYPLSPAHYDLRSKWLVNQEKINKK